MCIEKRAELLAVIAIGRGISDSIHKVGHGIKRIEADGAGLELEVRDLILTKIQSDFQVVLAFDKRKIVDQLALTRITSLRIEEIVLVKAAENIEGSGRRAGECAVRTAIIERHSDRENVLRGRCIGRS